MRATIAFWALDAVLFSIAAFYVVRLYLIIKKRPKGQPFKPLNLAMWIAVALALVVLFNLTGR